MIGFFLGAIVLVVFLAYVNRVRDPPGTDRRRAGEMRRRDKGATDAE